MKAGGTGDIVLGKGDSANKENETANSIHGSRPASAKSNQSNKSGSGRAKAVPSPVDLAKENPAADRRKMRQIIAEDPEWSLATVPQLAELCVDHIVRNFERET